MQDKQRLLHRIDYMSQVRDRHIQLDLSTSIYYLPISLPEIRHKKTSILQKIFNLFKPKKKPRPTPTSEVCFDIAYRKYITQIRAIDPVDKKLKTFEGVEIIATSEDDAKRLLDQCGQGYMQVIGQLVFGSNELDQDITFQERWN